MRIINKIKTPKDFLFFLWELPQNLLGLIVIYITKAWYSVAWEDCYFTKKLKNAVSLGRFIILPDIFYNNLTVIRHERGHQKQSRQLGFLYLLVVGLPSVIRNIWDRIAHKKWSSAKRDQWYYGGFPEKQADILGGVKRCIKI